MMENQVTLTDDELCLILMSLQMTISTYEKFVQTKGEQGLDMHTKNLFSGMKKLSERLNDQYC